MNEVTLLARLHKGSLTAMQMMPNELAAADGLETKGLAKWRYGKLTLTLKGRSRTF